VRSFSDESDHSRAIVIITDGENHEDDPVASAARAAEEGVRVFTIGVGSEGGTYIPLQEGGYMTDEEGNNVLTRLDAGVLQEVASAGNGIYVQSTNWEFGLTPIIDEIQKMEDKVTTTVAYEEYEELFMYFLAMALSFFVIEMLIGDRRSKIHLFRR
jgi:Ca-activated chloride channel family protein